MSKLISYYKDEVGNPIGTVVAIDAGAVGWAFCNKKFDKFSKKRGIIIAEGRANTIVRGLNRKSVTDVRNIPPEIRNLYYSMVSRSLKYFKKEN